MRPIVVALCIALFSFSASAARAGAWLLPEGKGQVIVTTTFANARNAYDAQGRLISTPSYRKFETRAYWEHGVTPWLTAVGEAGYLRFQGESTQLEYINLLTAQAKARLPLSTTPPSGPHYAGFGVSAVGARVRLYGDDVYIVSLEGSIRAAPTSARHFLDMRDNVQADIRLQVGRSYDLFGFPTFVDTQFGYRSRGQNGDEIRVDATAGIRPLPDVMLMAQSFSALSPRGGPAGVMASQKFQISGVYDATSWLSVQVGGVFGLSGVNSPAEQGVITALWLRY